MRGRETIDAIFIVRQLQEKRLEGNIELDLEKAYNKISREVKQRNWWEEKWWWNREVQESIKSIQGLERSAISPFLFVLAIDVLSEEIRNEELWELLYADDLVITAENEEALHRSVGEWQEYLERGGLKVNVNKTEGLILLRDPNVGKLFAALTRTTNFRLCNEVRRGQVMAQVDEGGLGGVVGMSLTTNHSISLSEVEMVTSW
ncbi:uncharacterized protein LOC135219045 [Macrobrachium nipponense]|uniref:uncharacterized protein LOC135219045 n=1 Tax=Macrobrachium nipponense TaxID=159736 RepID=UPI0030C8B5AC